MLISLPSIRPAMAGFVGAGLLSGVLIFGAAQVVQAVSEPTVAYNLR